MKSALSLQYALAVIGVLIWLSKSDDVLKCKDPLPFQCKCGDQGMLEDVRVESCLFLYINSKICKPCPGACEAFSRCKTCSTHGCLTCPQGKVGRFCEAEESSNNSNSNDGKSMSSEQESTKQIKKEGFPENSTNIPSISPSKENSSETPLRITGAKFQNYDFIQDKLKSSSKYIQMFKFPKHSVESPTENASVILSEVDRNRNATNEVTTQASALNFRISAKGNVFTPDIKPSDLQVNTILKEDTIFKEDTIVKEDTILKEDKILKEDTLLKEDTMLKEDAILEDDHPQQHGESSLISAEKKSVKSIKEEHSLETVRPILEVFGTTATEKTENNETVTSTTKIKSEVPQDSSRKDNKSDQFHQNSERTSRKGMDRSRSSSSNGILEIIKPLSSDNDKHIHNEQVTLSTGHLHEHEIINHLMQIVIEITSNKDANEGEHLRNDSSIEPLSTDSKSYRGFSHKIPMPNHPHSRNYFESSRSSPKSRKCRPCRLYRTSTVQSPKNARKHNFDRYDLIESEVTNLHSPNIKSNNGVSPSRFDTQPLHAFNIINNAHKSTLIPKNKPVHRRKSKQDKYDSKSEIKFHFNPFQTRTNNYRTKLNTRINTQTRHENVPLTKLERPLYDVSYPYNADSTYLSHRSFQVPMTRYSFFRENAGKNNRNKSNFGNSFKIFDDRSIQVDGDGQGHMLPNMPRIPYRWSSKLELRDYPNSMSNKKTSADRKKIADRIPLGIIDTSSASSGNQICNSTTGDCSTISSVAIESTRPKVTNFQEETSVEKESSNKPYSNKPDQIRITHLGGNKTFLVSRIMSEQYTQHHDMVTREENGLDTTVKPRDEYIRTDHLHDEINGTQLYNETDFNTGAYEEELTTDSKEKSQEHLFRVKRKYHGELCPIQKIIRHGDLDCTIWSYQKICRLTCHLGYTAPAVMYKCTANERWIPPLKPCVGHRHRGRIGYKALDPKKGYFVPEDIKESQSNGKHDDGDIKASQSNGEQHDVDFKAFQSNEEHGDEDIKASQTNGEDDVDFKPSQTNGEDDVDFKASQMNGEHDDEDILAFQSNVEHDDEDMKAPQTNGEDDVDFKAFQSNEEHDDEDIKESQSNGENDDKDIKRSQSNGEHDEKEIKASQSNGEHDDKDNKTPQSNYEYGEDDQAKKE